MIDMDETWSYDHVNYVPSDTHRICDWSNVEGLELPTCTAGICPGHKGSDILPFSGIKDLSSSDESWTNLEFYEYIHPDNEDIPYVYDSLTHWAGCTDESLWAEYTALQAGTIQMKETHAANRLDMTAHIEDMVMS